MLNLRRILVTLVVALPLLLALSYPWRDATHGPGEVASGIGWIGFLLDLVALLAVSVVAAVQARRRRRV
jgi:hypothetical protein